MSDPDKSADRAIAQASAAQWWGEAMTKVFVAVLGVAIIGLGGWMFTMYTQLITLNVKLDGIAADILEAKNNVIETKAMAAENARDVQTLRSEMLKADDVQTMLRPLEYRINQLEKRRR